MLLLLYRRRVSTQVCAKMISIWYSWNEANRVGKMIRRACQEEETGKERDVCAESLEHSRPSEEVIDVLVGSQMCPHQRRKCAQIAHMF